MKIDGLWSAGNYASFEESFAAFMENNLGFFYYMNIEYDEIELFKWKVEDSEAISINGIAVYSFEDEILSKIDNSQLTSLKNIKFRKYKKVIFNGKEIDVLEFSQPLVSGVMEFGLEGKNVLNSHTYRRVVDLIGEKLPKEFRELYLQ